MNWTNKIKSIHFKPEELLPIKFTDITVLDPKLLKLIDEIRELIDLPCTINDYIFGGSRQWCGYRSSACNIGAAHSQHKLGKAADLHFKGMNADDARQLILKAVDAGALNDLGGLELAVSWVHVDVRPRINGKLVTFSA